MNQPLPALGTAFAQVFSSGQWFEFALMGGLAMSVPRWWRMVERDRPTRWSFGNLLKWGFACMFVSGIATNEFPLALAVFAVQVVFSHLWLRHFRFGPMEWLWRSLTYAAPQPMRLQAT